VPDDIRCLYCNCNKHNGMYQDKNVINPVSVAGNVRMLPYCGIQRHSEVYMLKTHKKDKKLEVRCYSGFSWLK
jgi:hypothetical protein